MPISTLFGSSDATIFTQSRWVARTRLPNARDDGLGATKKIQTDAACWWSKFRNVLILFLAIGIGAQSAMASPQAAALDAGDFVIDLHLRVYERLTESGIGLEEQRNRLRALLKESFNVPMIARFALGRYWRTARENERAEFVDIFEEIIVRSFLPIFIKYSDASLEVIETRWHPKDSSSVVVKSKIHRSSSEGLRVDWRGRLIGDELRIVDVVVEGVSIAFLLRSKFNLSLRRQGGDIGAFVGQLRQQLSSDSEFADGIATRMLARQGSNATN